MDIKKLKKTLILCLALLILLITATSCDFDKKNSDEYVQQSTDINVDSVHVYEKIDYNNLTSAQKGHISEIYSNNVLFTEKGVEVYYESNTSGNLQKIITSVWPQDQIGNLIPKPEIGELDRVEYSENWINVYIENVKKSEVKDYFKVVKKYKFEKDEQKNDGKVMLEYKVYDELGNQVKIRYLKEKGALEIFAKKAV